MDKGEQQIKKVFKYIWIGIGLSSVGYLLYFATQLSAVYDPIKTYKFSVSKDRIKVQLEQISISRPNITITFTDSIGTEKDGRDYHGDIDIRTMRNENAYAYHIIYKKAPSRNDNGTKSEIELISAVDYALKTQVYKIDDQGAERLIGIFEKEIIDKLRADSKR